MATPTLENKNAALQAPGAMSGTPAYSSTGSAIIPPAPSTPSPISVSGLNTPTVPVTLPPAPAVPAPTDYTAAFKSLDSLLTPPAPSTAAQNNDALSSAILDSTATLGTKTATQANVEDATARALGAKSGLSDFTTQLRDITNQMLTLKNENSAIPLQTQNEFTGRASQTGIDTATIGRQRTLAVQYLGLGSLAATLQGNIQTAQDTAKRAVDLEFAPEQAKLDYLTKAYELNKDTLMREDATAAKALEVKLSERTRLLADQKENKASALALANNAVKNFSGDAAAQAAAQQVLALDVNSPDYLKNVFSLVGKYQTDPAATQKAIDDHLATQAQIQLAHANVTKINADAAKVRADAAVITPTTQNAPYINAFNNALAGVGPQKSAQASAIFSKYMANGDLNTARDYIVRTALSNAGQDQQNQAVGRTQAIAAMDDVEKLLAQAKANGATTNLVTGSLVNIANNLGASTNPDLSYIGSRILQSLITYRKGMTGVAFGPQEAADYKKIFPDITNIDSLNTAKIQALRDSLNLNNRATLSFYIGSDNYDSLFPNSSTVNLPSNQSNTSTAPVDPTYLDWLKKNGLSN